MLCSLVSNERGIALDFLVIREKCELTVGYMSSGYGEAVLDRIRCILVSYHYLRRDKNNQPYSWAKMAADIRIFMGSDPKFPQNSLENFARGLRHTDTAKRIAGIRKYSVPEPDRMEAIIAYLTDPKSKWYACDKDVLLAPAKPLVPLELLEFLNEKRDEPRTIKMYRLRGQWKIVQADDNTNDQTRLTLLKTEDARMAMAELSVQEAEDPLPELYSGWAIATMDDTILLAVQHLHHESNRIYLSLGIDNAVYRSEMPRVLVFLEHQYPEDAIEVNSSDDETTLLSEIINSWQSQLYLFRKVQNPD